MNRCIECGKKIDQNHWFCSFTCAAYCCMWSYKEGLRSPDEALKRLTIRHLDHEMPEDLIRIEKMLERLGKRK
ncbi:MAG: hypothetical protein GF411_08740 [Candidatus Lokiarchaeota archaeon]|nr:hypothetical protein [Candidatus Lokiarchaeota archaeon]